MAKLTKQLIGSDASLSIFANIHYHYVMVIKQTRSNRVCTWKKIAVAHSIILAGPVYNYDLNATAKNFIEWTGVCLEQKSCACMLAAGGKTPTWLLCHF